MSIYGNKIGCSEVDEELFYQNDMRLWRSFLDRAIDDLAPAAHPRAAEQRLKHVLLERDGERAELGVIDLRVDEEQSV